MGEKFDALLGVEKKALHPLIESGVQLWQSLPHDILLTPESIEEYRDKRREALAGDLEIVAEALEHYDRAQNAERSYLARLARGQREHDDALRAVGTLRAEQTR